MLFFSFVDPVMFVFYLNSICMLEHFCALCLVSLDQYLLVWLPLRLEHRHRLLLSHLYLQALVLNQGCRLCPLLLHHLHLLHLYLVVLLHLLCLEYLHLLQVLKVVLVPQRITRCLLASGQRRSSSLRVQWSASTGQRLEFMWSLKYSPIFIFTYSSGLCWKLLKTFEETKKPGQRLLLMLLFYLIHAVFGSAQTVQMFSRKETSFFFSAKPVIIENNRWSDAFVTAAFLEPLQVFSPLLSSIS